MSVTPSDQHWRVLLVDDSPDDRAELRRLLLQGSPRHYELSEAASGEDAVRRVLDAPEGPPTCVVLDHYLPDEDGADVLARLIGPEGYTVCPVVVITGVEDQDVGRQVLRAGAQDFVGKAWMTAQSLTRALENAVERWGMTRELHNRETRLRLALEALRTGIWTWDLATDAVTWSSECYDIHGVAPDAFDGTGKGFFALVHPGDRDAVEAAVRQCIAERARYSLQFRVVRPDGAVVWVENLGRATHRRDGRAPRMTGTITDISERKLHEAQLLAGKRELRAITDHTPDVIARFDRDLRHVFVNAVIEKITGRAPSEFLGLTNRELGMPSELCDRMDEALSSVFRTGAPSAIEFAFPAASGLRQFESRLVAEVGEGGQVDFVLAVANEVTDRKAVEQALRVSEDRLARAQAAAQVGTWDWNVVTGEATWTEEAWRLFGPAPFSAPVTFDFWVSTIHPVDREEATAHARAALQGGRYHHEFRALRPDGTILWLEARGVAVLDEEGRAVRLLGTVHDVTARREAESALKSALETAERAVRARDQLVSLVSHDMRTPLNALMMGIAVLERATTDGTRSTLAKMMRQTQRMERMIDELLDVARLHAGEPLALQRESTDVVGVVRTLITEHQANAPLHVLELVAAEDKIVGTWDEKRIDRVLNNLIGNAIKYSPRGGRVRVVMEIVRDDGVPWALVTVSDEGMGIAPADRQRIFEWFSRGRNALKTTIPGTGIGLAGARDIVAQHGGSISLDSREGKGSTFTVRLPIEPPSTGRVPEAGPSSVQVPLFDD